MRIIFLKNNNVRLANGAICSALRVGKDDDFLKPANVR